MTVMTTRRGKIARLPFATREEINRRLLENEEARDLLAWLNAEQKLSGASAITPQNLSEWRSGGFADWLEKRERVEKTKSLAEYCYRIADAGGGSMDLPAAIAGGQLMEVLEAFDPQSLKTVLADKPDTWIGILEMVARLQRSKADEVAVRQNDVRLAQSSRKLALEEARFQRTTCELFLKWRDNKRAEEIASSKSKPDVKISQLRELMFGPLEPGDRGYEEKKTA